MAFSERMAWEVRSTGSDSNSGGFRGGWSISPPPAPVLSSGGGGSIGAGTYYIVLTFAQLDGASDSGGKGTLETPKSAETAITVGGSSTITITSPANPLLADAQNRGLGDVAYCAYWSSTTGGPYHPVNSNGASNTFSTKCGTNNVMTQNFSSVVNDYGPPGTDYTQQDGVQLTYTDLVIDGSSNVKLTSVAHPGTVDLVGNTINVTSGTGFTVQRLEILNVDGAGAYYVDKSAGTTSSTGGHGVLGGGLATPGMAGNLIELGVDSEVAFIKNGTYTLSNSVNVAGGRFQSDSNNSQIIGYDTNRTTYNRDTNRPTLQAGANNMVCVIMNRNYSVVANLVFAPNGHTGVTGVSARDRNILVRDCQSNAVDTGFDTDHNGVVFIRCYSNGDTAKGFYAGGVGDLYFNCVANVQNAIGFNLNGGGCMALHCVSYCNGGQGFHSDANGNFFANCTAYDTTGGSAIGSVGFTTNNAGTGISSTFINCAATNFAGTGSAGFDFGVSLPSNLMLHCAGFNNTVNFSQVWGVNIDVFKVLTQDPFVNAAGLDFGLNNVTNGGKTLRGAGQPGHAALTQLPGGVAADSYVDIGAVQTSSLQSGMLVHPGMTGGMRA